MTHSSHPTQADVAMVRAALDWAVAGRTLCTEFLRNAGERAGWLALRGPAGAGDRDGDPCRDYSWSDYAARVANVAGGLRRLGLRRGELVAILCRNRPELRFVDLGTLFAGGTPFSVSDSAPAEQLGRLLEHSGAAVVVVQDHDFLARVRRISDRLLALRHVVLIDPGREPAPPGVTTLGELEAGEPLDLADAARSVRPEDPATVIYSSDTAGAPKGVLLTHRNVCHAVRANLRVVGHNVGGLRQLSHLPMAHIGGRQVTYYTQVIGGTCVVTCENPADVAALLKQVRPQCLFCAPGMWGSLLAAIEAVPAAQPRRRAAFDGALGLGWRVHHLTECGTEVPRDLRDAWERAYGSAVAPVLNRAGLSDLVLAVSAGGPPPPETLKFLQSCGIVVSLAYGCAETAGFACWSPHEIVPGTFGKPLPGLEMRLAEVVDGAGEIEVRGPSVFGGYLHDPERTAEAFTPDGFHRTGDIGRWDADGNLVVIDRKDECLELASGHQVSPARLEDAIRSEFPLIGQACAIGDARPHVTMIMTFEPEPARAWAISRGLAGTLHTLAGCPEMRAEVQAAVDRINAGVPPPERIQGFHVVGDVWLPDTDVLTPSAKVNRPGVLARYAREVESLYDRLLIDSTN